MTVTGYSISNGTGLASNYQLNTSSLTTTANINQAVISGVTGITTSNKVYDATTTASLNTSGVSFTGIIGGDVVTVSGGVGAFADKNVGTGKTVTVTGLTFGGADAGNYTFTGGAPTLTANITPAAISAVTGIAANKVYDGTTAATLNTTGATFVGKQGSDSLTITAGSGVFADKNVGTGKTVTLTGVTFGGADAGNYTFVAASSTTTANITAAPLTLTGITANNKVYDSTTTASLNLGSAVLSGMIGGDVVTLGGATGSFANKNVGTAKTVSVSGLSLGGADAGNYMLGGSSPTTTANITPAAITGISGVVVATRAYDGTTAATLSGASVNFAGKLGSDVLTLGSATGVFADKNAAAGKTVNVTGITLGGADAGNYTYSGPATVTATGTISRASITVSGVTAASKIYDGTTAATLNTAGASFSGIIAGDVVGVSGLSGSFADKNVGDGKQVVFNALSLTGADAANYTISSSTLNTTASITPATITGLSGLSVATKAYDGTTTATLSTTGVTFTGRLGADDLSLGAVAANFNDKNVGAGKAVFVSGVTLTGADARNYTLAVGVTATLTGTINPAILTLAGLTVGNKTYDATTTANVTNFGTLAGLVAGETLNFQVTGANFADKNVGAGKAVTVTYTLANGTGQTSNYQFSGAGLSTVANITAAQITAVNGITAANKTFDGDTSATLNTTGVNFAGRLGSDVLTLGAGLTGAFVTADAGLGKTVNITGITLSGADAGNYILANSTTTTTASITSPIPDNIINAVTPTTSVTNPAATSSASTSITLGGAPAAFQSNTLAVQQIPPPPIVILGDAINIPSVANGSAINLPGAANDTRGDLVQTTPLLLTTPSVDDETAQSDTVQGGGDSSPAKSTETAEERRRRGKR